MTTSPTSLLIASLIAPKSSTSWLGVPSGVRAWMWIIAPPSSTIRRASAAYSSGVYGIAGHWSRLAIVPEIEQVRTTGSSRLMAFALSLGSLLGWCDLEIDGVDAGDARAPLVQAAEEAVV